MTAGKNHGPVQPGRRPRAVKPKPERLARSWAGPDVLLTISTIAVMVILVLGGVYAVRGIIDGAHHACEQTSSGPAECSQPGDTDDIGPLIF